jgi:hypothetical protein
VTGLHRETRRTPQAGSGVQQTRRADAEQAVEVVRNHEGGTRIDGLHRRTEGSASFWEWTHRKTNGRGVQANESHERKNSDFFGSREEFWQRRERSEGEEKVTRADNPRNETVRKRRRPVTDGLERREHLEDRAGNGQRSSRRRGRRTDPLPTHLLKPTQCPTGTAASTP